MPIGGFVAVLFPDTQAETLQWLKSLPGVTVHETEVKEKIILVLEADSSRAVDDMSENIKKHTGIASLDLAYLNMEDEVLKDETRQS